MKSIRQKAFVALAALFFCLVQVSAFAAQSVEVPEIGMTFQVPDGMHYFTREIESETLGLALFGMDRDELRDYYIEQEIYLDCVPEDMSYEITVFVNGDTPDDLPFNDWTQEELEAFALELRDNGEFESGELYQSGETIYIKLSGPGDPSYENGPREIWQYYTYYQGKDIHFLVYAYGGPVSEAAKETVETLIDGTVFAEPTAPAPSGPTPDFADEPFAYEHHGGYGSGRKGLEPSNPMQGVFGGLGMFAYLFLIVAEAVLNLLPLLVYRLAHGKPVSKGKAVVMCLALSFLLSFVGWNASNWTGLYLPPALQFVWFIVGFLILTIGKNRPVSRQEQTPYRQPPQPVETRTATPRRPVQRTQAGRPQNASRPVVRTQQPLESHKLRRCPDCGAKVRGDIKICPKCGSELYYYHSSADDE